MSPMPEATDGQIYRWTPLVVRVEAEERCRTSKALT